MGGTNYSDLKVPAVDLEQDVQPETTTEQPETATETKDATTE